MYDWGAICNTRNLGNFVPFAGAGFHLGWIHRSRLDALSAESIFDVSPDEVKLDDQLRSPRERTEALGQLSERWRQREQVSGWREELYDVIPYPGGPVVAQIERAMTRPFGILNHGSHINGFVRDGSDRYMWIARRSDDKPTFPGLLDQIAAGGIASSLTPSEVARKEAWEEAGIGSELTKSIKCVSVVTMFADFQQMIFRDIDYVFDLELPVEFVPRPIDAEVSEFTLYSVKSVLATVTNSTRFKPDCNLVILDFLIRHGLTQPGDRRYIESALGLRKGVC